jgi:hypothetical protein
MDSVLAVADGHGHDGRAYLSRLSDVEHVEPGLRVEEDAPPTGSEESVQTRRYSHNNSNGSNNADQDSSFDEGLQSTGASSDFSGVENVEDYSMLNDSDGIESSAEIDNVINEVEESYNLDHLSSTDENHHFHPQIEPSRHERDQFHSDQTSDDLDPVRFGDLAVAQLLSSNIRPKTRISTTSRHGRSLLGSSIGEDLLNSFPELGPFFHDEAEGGHSHHIPWTPRNQQRSSHIISDMEGSDTINYSIVAGQKE